MLFEYQGMQAEISYSAITKCYYGEIEYNDQHVIVFQTSCKHQLLEIIRKAVDKLLDAQ